MKNVQSGKGNHILKIRAFSKHEDMVRNGWKHFETRVELEKEAIIYDTSPDMKNMAVTEQYKIG
jgi:hypothetical protein